jgi:hypothetical protein
MYALEAAHNPEVAHGGGAALTEWPNDQSEGDLNRPSRAVAIAREELQQLAART